MQQFEESLKKGRETLQKTTDDHLLNTKWRMLSGGKLMMEQTRYEAIREGMINHMAHHRGQLTTLMKQAGVDPGVTDLPWLPGIVRIID